MRQKQQTAQTIDDWVSLMNARGHAATFARTTEPEKKIVELSTAQEWATALRAVGQSEISDIRLGEDPPDCWGRSQNKDISVELIELVDGDALKFLSRKPREHMTIAKARALFDSTQWNAQRFEKALTSRLLKKNKIYAGSRVIIDALVIHTDEPWLSPFDVSVWLKDMNFEPTQNITRAYLLMTYFPGYAEHWPLFQLFGAPL